MSDEESIGSMLSNSDAPGAVAAEAPRVEVEAPAQTQTRDESGKFAKPVEAPAPVAEVKPPESQRPEAPKPRADVAAIIDERRRRQAAEQELERLRKEATPAQRPSVFDNEDQAIASRVQEHIAPLREGLFYQSVEIARSRYGAAYEEAEAAFVEASADDPQLIARLRASHNPGAFVYAEGLRLKELAPHGGDFGKYREALTAGHTQALAERDTRIKALEAQLAAAQQANTELQSLPRSLNKSSGASPKAGEDDDESIESIARFNDRKSG